MVKHYLTVALLAILFFHGGPLCHAQSSSPVSISNTREFRPRNPSEIKTVEDVMDAVITVTSKDLGLPVVEPLYLHLHKSANDFAAYGGRSGRRLSPEVVSFALAVAQENQFHVNMEKARGRPLSTPSLDLRS